ncbi:MAG: DNA polymerase III subunit delta' [Acidobacteria bacterium]|nr:MAG: DNA polymerase III subunit delta' [Acidobacteriota bacterium]
MAFARILGHPRLRGLLARAVGRRRLPPALLFSGPSGVGKKTLALAVGRALLCEGDDGDACDGCAACSRAARGLHPDAILVEPDGASIKIEQVRDAVREIAGRPFEGRARAFVFDEAHLVTEQAQNALLKSLEEPPATSHVFLVTASPQALLPTIRSRCQTLRFSPLPQSLLETHLRETSGLSPDEARLRAALSGGSLGVALAFESEAWRDLRVELLEMLEKLGRAGTLGRMDAAERLSEMDDPILALTALRSLLRDVAALRAGSPALLNADVAARLEPLARGPLGERAGEMARAAGETRDALEGKITGTNLRRGPANALLAFDVLMDALGAPA